MENNKKCLIKFQETSIGYGHKKIIVKNFSTKIYEKDFVSIIGPNGCGKTTILKSLFNLSDLISGKIKINNKEIKEYSKKEISKLISFVPQISYFPSDVTVYEFVLMGRFPYGNVFSADMENDKKITLKAIKDVGLEGLEYEYIHNLSGGQQQRALIALSLAQNTEIIILDEPTNHLDIKMQLEIMNILSELNKNLNKTIIMVNHDINQSLKFAKKVIVMKFGNKVTEGACEEVINNKLIKSVFEVNSEIENKNNKKIIKDFWI